MNRMQQVLPGILHLVGVAAGALADPLLFLLRRHGKFSLAAIHAIFFVLLNLIRNSVAGGHILRTSSLQQLRLPQMDLLINKDQTQ